MSHGSWSSVEIQQLIDLTGQMPIRLGHGVSRENDLYLLYITYIVSLVGQ